MSRGGNRDGGGRGEGKRGKYHGFLGEFADFFDGFWGTLFELHPEDLARRDMLVQVLWSNRLKIGKHFFGERKRRVAKRKSAWISAWPDVGSGSWRWRKRP